MLGLKLATEDKWVSNCVEGNYEEILSDHAWCEQKAASNAITIIVKYPEHSELVTAMTELVREEMEHFNRVHTIIIRRGYKLGHEGKDEYVGELMNFVRKGEGRDILLLDRLLFAAMIEARSCERFKVLSEQVADKELSEFYAELMASEARHYTMFIRMAKKYTAAAIVDKRWEEWLVYEAGVVKGYGKNAKMHG